MPLTKEHKNIIVDYCLEEGGFSKGILESTPVGEAYEKGEVTEHDICEYISSINKREKEFLKNDH